jgi:hypothetical protein
MLRHPCCSLPESGVIGSLAAALAVVSRTYRRPISFRSGHDRKNLFLRPQLALLLGADAS